MIDARFFLSAPRSYKGIINIYPPSVKDVVTNVFYSTFLKILTTSQEEIEDEYVKDKIDGAIPTPYEYLLNRSKENQTYEILVSEAFKFFCHTEVTFLYDLNRILIGNIETLLKEGKDVKDLVFLTESDFFDFQNMIRESVAEDKVEKPNPNEDPRVKRIKAKARYRDKIKAKTGGGLNISASMTSICCMGLGITPLNIGEMSYVAFKAILSMYQDKEKFELDTKSLLAGVVSSKKIKPKYWIKNFE